LTFGGVAGCSSLPDETILDPAPLFIVPPRRVRRTAVQRFADGCVRALEERFLARFRASQRDRIFTKGTSMTSSDEKNEASAYPAVKGSNALAAIPPEQARGNFRAFLLANPNFFGNLPDSEFQPVLSIQGNTAYESLGCVGFNPRFEQLRATIQIKLDSGYDGGICTAGSYEYVRFYLSYDGGTTWLDQGLTSVNVFDVPGPKPLEYAVTLGIAPKEDFCFVQNLPLVRAILSWNAPPPPNSPSWVPVWGDSVDARIQIDGYEYIPFPIFLDAAKLTLPEEFKEAIDQSQDLEVAAPKVLSPVELQELYAGTSVPQHRYLAPAVASAIKAPAARSAPAKSFAGIADIDVASLIGSVLNTTGDTTYEQLDCLGLNPATSQLTGILTIKQSAGYSGGPCTSGSTEYVAFWVNWGSGLEYAGTTSVKVHDFSDLPAGGLQYSVFLPIDLLSHRQPCKHGAKIVEVCAVLSWSTPPSTTNPNAGVVWGNSLKGLILIPPGPSVGAGQQLPMISAVGDIPVSKIDGSGRITGANTITTNAFYADAPFGGAINISGGISNPSPGLLYRLMIAPHGSANFVPIVNEPQGIELTIVDLQTQTTTSVTLHANGPNGYYAYPVPTANQYIQDQLLGVYNSTAADTGVTYDLRLDLSTDGIPANDTPSSVVAILINNQQPTASLTLDGECGDFTPGGAPITGTFTATATDFGSYSFQILPNVPAAGAVVTPPEGSSSYLGGAVADPGVANQAVSIATAGMQPCGYSFTLYVYDRTNVDNGLTSNSNFASTGFCLQSEA
jgi:hypothetical protein